MADSGLTIGKVGDSIIIQLHEEFKKLFGNGNQAFCMEYPPRNLNARDYAYTIEDSTGVLFKPQTVAEAEFNLSDNIIDLASIVQGSSGERVSNLYKTVLNNYIPRLHYATRLAEEKGKLKSWLLQPITGTVLDYDEGKDIFVFLEFEGTRMEYSARLYRTYLYKRQAFNEKVNQKKTDARNSENTRQSGIEFADWLSTVAATNEEILSTFYNDAVVRGNLHEVNSAISFLDIPSLGQRLNEIKRDLRSNVKRSVIGGGDIYTVNFSPSNWFESLTLAPSPIDVVTNASYRENLIQAKSNELKNTRQQLSSLQNINIDTSTQDNLEQDIKNLNATIDKCYEEVRKNFQGRLVSAVKFAQEALSKTAEFALAVSSEGTSEALTAEITKLAQKKARTINPDEISHIGEIVGQTTKALELFTQLDRARQESVEMRSKLALAKSSDYASQIKMLQHQINKLSEGLKSLESEDALYPSSLEQLKSDVYYTAKERASGGDAVDNQIQTDIAHLKALELSTESASVEGADFLDQMKTLLSEAIDKANKLLGKAYGGEAKTERFISEVQISSLFEKNSLKENWETILNSIIPGSTDKKCSYKELLQIRSDAKIICSKTNPEEQKITLALKELQIDIYSKISFGNKLSSTDFLNRLNKVIDHTITGGDIKTAKEISVALNKSSSEISGTVINRDHKIVSKVISLAKRLGVGKPSEERDDYYQTIIVEMECNDSSSNDNTSSNASSVGAKHDHWFQSGSFSMSSADSNTRVISASENMKITVKLRATKVNIERGGWFGVDILRLTEGMFHVDPNLKSAKGDEYANFTKHGKATSAGKFTHYPMSFLIVKDVEVRMSSSKAFNDDSQRDLSYSSSSRRDSWFSSSHGESSQSSHHKETVNNDVRYIQTISLPSPAIIGWFQQVTPKDESVEYAKTEEKKEEFSKVIDEFLKSIVFK
jgi:hypothetical protein